MASVTVDLNPEYYVAGPNIVISGANVHIVNGSGQTGLTSGKGNLILGYDEARGGATSNDRAGSHSLIIGRYNRWLAGGFGNLACGEFNVAGNVGSRGYGQFVAGYNNETYYQYNSILGGQSNVTYAFATTVAGGSANSAMAWSSVVLGGEASSEYGYNSVTLGGRERLGTGQITAGTSALGDWSDSQR